ncbi:hypothetical protein Acsp02_88690 [Actinoplanes sp. NBRC 103695]|nr:hypothetical protein Acsp02_88690 [Actinoplanes sp. NBRC 103695]
MTADAHEATNNTDESEVFELSPEEWQAAVLRGLERVGLTRAELKEQARERNFSSTEARKLWMIIGDPA